MAQVAVTNLGSRWKNDPQPVKGYATIRAAAVLTGSYVNTNEVDLSNFSKVKLYFNITQASLTSFEYIVWESFDGTTWFREGQESVAVGTITDSVHNYTFSLSANVAYFKQLDFGAKFLRLQVKGTGTVAGSSLTVIASGVR